LAQGNIAPTRSNLLNTQETLQRAREGYEILDRKREVLLSELIHVFHDSVQLQANVQDLLKKAYAALEIARLDMGREHLEWAALSVNSTIEVEIQPRSVMGVVIPRVSSAGAPPETPYGLGNTTVALDEAALCFRDVLEKIPELAEVMTTVWRLARELKKTQRRVNALEHFFIPRYEALVTFIESALEEREREELFRLKLIKQQHAENYESKDNTR
jgi:V/A-type H+-transporting ATPase subunit D